MNRKKESSSKVQALLAMTGLYLFNNGGCLPDNFYADLVGGLITVGAEIVVSDAVTDAITPTEG